MIDRIKKLLRRDDPYHYRDLLEEVLRNVSSRHNIPAAMLENSGLKDLEELETLAAEEAKTHALKAEQEAARLRLKAEAEAAVAEEAAKVARNQDQARRSLIAKLRETKYRLNVLEADLRDLPGQIEGMEARAVECMCGDQSDNMTVLTLERVLSELSDSREKAKIFPRAIAVLKEERTRLSRDLDALV